MRNRSVLRRSLNYVGLSASVVEFIAWAVSIICVFGTSAGGCIVVFADGAFLLIIGMNLTYDEFLPVLQVSNPDSYGFRMPEMVTFRGMRLFSLPLWIPFLIGVIPTLFSFWLERRAAPPCLCRVCDYNLSGNTSGHCPECGTSIPKETRATLTTDPPKQ